MTVAADTAALNQPLDLPKADETARPYVRAYRPETAIPSWAASLILTAPDIIRSSPDQTGSPEADEEPAHATGSDAGTTEPGLDLSERTIMGRQNLLARKYIRGQLSREESARLTIATERAAVFFPRVSAADYENLTEAAEHSKKTRELLAETDKLLADL